MIEQEKVSTIVMLCMVQKGFTGCSQYFPPGVDDDSSSSGDNNKIILQSHGDLKITNTSTKNIDEGLTVRELELTGLSGEKRIVKHMHFKLWPNYGVVENVSQLSNFVQAVHQSHQKDGGPLVVHCSGGVGRSGTFTTIYTIHNLIQEMIAKEDNSLIDDYIGEAGDLCLHPLVCHLRRVRHPWMVEGEHQYLLAYQTCCYLLQQATNHSQ